MNNTDHQHQLKNDEYPYKGTPHSTRLMGDFRTLKKAHQRAYEQKYNTNNICRICNKFKATITWENQCGKCNICKKCHLILFID